MKPYPNEELDRMSKREIIRLYKRTVEQFNDAVPVRHGKWIPVETETGIVAYGVHEMTVTEYECSECFGQIDISEGHFKYCPHCGARMDAERKEE